MTYSYFVQLHYSLLLSRVLKMYAYIFKLEAILTCTYSVFFGWFRLRGQRNAIINYLRLANNILRYHLLKHTNREERVFRWSLLLRCEQQQFLIKASIHIVVVEHLKKAEAGRDICILIKYWFEFRSFQ